MAANIDYNVQSVPSNFNWAVSGELLVAFARSGIVSRTRFQEYIDAVRTRGIKYVLSVSEGNATIDSVQRKTSADIAKEHNIRIAVIVDSALTRGLVTAFSWLGVNMKSFHPNQEVEAVKYLSAPNIDSDRVSDILKHLREATVDLD